jgi:hypothetical protein
VPLKAGTYRAKIATSNLSLSSPEACFFDLDIDMSGNVKIKRPHHLNFSGPVWIAPTRFLRRAK